MFLSSEWIDTYFFFNKYSFELGINGCDVDVLNLLILYNYIILSLFHPNKHKNMRLNILLTFVTHEHSY